MQPALERIDITSISKRGSVANSFVGQSKTHIKKTAVERNISNDREGGLSRKDCIVYHKLKVDEVKSPGGNTALPLSGVEGS